MDTNNPAYKHGHAGRAGFSPTYYSWASMISRCTNKNTQHWPHYGGRGVEVCRRWHDFQIFLLDMGRRPPGTSLDRIDNDGNYEPGNCRWADAVTQARNSKQVVWVKIDGVNKRLVEWCEQLGLSINTVRDRVKHYGMSYQQAITTPLRDRAESARRMTAIREKRRTEKK